MKWNNHKQLVRKNIEGKYSINPWTLIWANDRYYLYGYDTFEKNGVRKERHYKVDKLDNIEIMETDRQGKTGRCGRRSYNCIRISGKRSGNQYPQADGAG